MSNVASELSRLRDSCRRADTSFAAALARHVHYRLRGRNIVASDGVRIRGLERLELGGRLKIGLDGVGFADRSDITLLNLRGELSIAGNFAIGRGCRFDIGPGARASFETGHVNPNTRFVIMHGLRVGAGCAISWDCQFIDDDFHRISYPGRRAVASGAAIEIGRQVWIGSGVSVLKGAVIPDGCVVAAGAVVTARFDEPAALLAGNPARVIRSGVSWQ